MKWESEINETYFVLFIFKLFILYFYVKIQENVFCIQNSNAKLYTNLNLQNYRSDSQFYV